MIMDFQNGFSITEDGQVYQRNIATMPDLHPIPDIYKMHYKLSPNLYDFTKSFAFNCTTETYATTANKKGLNTDKILIPGITKNHHFVHGASPHFGQNWRLTE